MKRGYPSILFIPVILVLLAACNGNKTKPGAVAPGEKKFNFDKLLGTWQSEDGKSFEQWTKNDDSHYQSTSFSLNGKDTIVDESVKVYFEKGNWIYEATVKGQNEGKAVKFISSSLDETGVQFSNPAHDFPTDVNYTMTGVNTMHAFITGPNNRGGNDTVPYNYRRVDNR